MKNLPKVSSFEITKALSNSQDRYHGKTDIIINEKKDILKEINYIFSSKDHVYKSHVLITLKSETIDTMIIGKTAKELLTLDGKKIKIIDILDIKKI